MTATVDRAPARPADPGAGAGAPGPDGGSRWARTRPLTRVLVVVGGLVVGVNLALGLLGEVVGRDPGGPSGSSLATGADGVAAWGDLLRTRGVEVTSLRRPLGEADLPAGGTVVAVDADEAPTAAGTGALADHLAAGGRVVLVGAAGADQVAALTGQDLGWTPDGDDEVVVEPGAAGLDGVARLEGDGTGAFAGPDAPEGFSVLARGATGEDPVIVAAGPLVAVADASLLWNANLGRADDAGLAVALAGPGPVAFAEAEHGFGAASGLSALPGRWRLAAGAAVVVVLLGMWAVGQRLGPPDRPDRVPPPPRRAYVDAVAAALSRTSSSRTSSDRSHP